MINYRVENLEVLAEELKKSGVQIVDSIETYDYGKFLHIINPKGNNKKITLNCGSQQTDVCKNGGRKNHALIFLPFNIASDTRLLFG